MKYSLPCLPVAAYPALIRAVTSRPDYPTTPSLVGAIPSSRHIDDVLATFNRNLKFNALLTRYRVSRAKDDALQP